MNPTLKNVLAVVVGLAVGSGINMLIITYGGLVIAPPEGVDPSDAESIAANIHLFEPKHFAVPFLAHALGTLVGAVIAFLLAANNKLMCAYIVGFVFFILGIVVNFMIPAPLWFKAVDILLAYIPMAWIGAKVGAGLQKSGQ